MRVEVERVINRPVALEVFATAEGSLTPEALRDAAQRVAAGR